MSQDDPFGGSTEHTQIKPAPGGRRGSRPPPPTAQFYAAPPGPGEPVPVSGLTPLLIAANPLLSLVVQLRATLSYPDAEMLRDSLTRSIREFEATARSGGVGSEVVVAARYCLCTLLDETIASTPWGDAADWSHRSLLIAFHNESWGGKKFFALLKRVSEDARGNIDLLELMYLCLAFGFQGQYGVEGSRAQLDEERERVHRTIRSVRGEQERDLSPQWRGVVSERNSMIRWNALWVVAAVAALLLFVVYVVLSLSLNRASDPVYAGLHDIPGNTAPQPVRHEPPPADTPRLSVLLAPEIEKGWVTVTQRDDGEVVTLRGDGLFDSGSAALRSAFVPILDRIAAALNQVPGPVLVTGHTDNQRIFSPRFQSNWHLSKERAESVVALLAGRLQAPNRLRADGRADREPINANDTPENRARNRRVEITVGAAAVTGGAPRRATSR